MHSDASEHYLIYTRPELVFAFGVLSAVSAPSRAIPDAPTPTHRRRLARTIRYISTSRDLGLFFLAASFTLVCYTDASFSTECNSNATGASRSRSGGCVLADGAEVAVDSRRSCSSSATEKSGGTL